MDEAWVGSWRLVEFKGQREDGTWLYPYGMDPQGLLIYCASGMMGVQAMPKDRPTFSQSDPWHWDPEKACAVMEHMFSYFGRYEVDASTQTVYHHIQASVFPNWDGLTVARRFAFQGDRLILTASDIPSKDQGCSTLVLTWDKIIQASPRLHLK